MKGSRISYLVNQFNNLIWNFVYYKNNGIIYRVMKNGEWSDYNLIVKNCKENFSIVVLPDDILCLIYEDQNSNVFIKSFDGITWYKNQIISNENKNLIHIEFKAIESGGLIYLFYTSFDKASKEYCLYYQLIDSKYNVRSQHLVDVIGDSSSNRFVVLSDEENISILYQKKEEKYILGFKLLNTGSNDCSDFTKVDESEVAFLEYSSIIEANDFHMLYVKKVNGLDNVVYAKASNENYHYLNFDEDKNIEACSICAVRGHIFCSWVKDSSIYSVFSVDDGKIFSSPPYIEKQDSSKIMKCVFVFNKTKIFKEVKLNEFYGRSYQSVYYPLFINLFLFSKNKNNYLMDYFTYYMEQMLSKLKQEDEGGTEHLSRLETAESFIKELTESIEDNKKRIDELEIALENRELLISSKDKIIIQLKDLLEGREELINSKDKTIELLKKDLKVREESIINYERKMDLVAKRYSTFQEDKKLIVEHINKMQTTINEKDSTIVYLKKQIEDMQKDMYCLKQRVEEDINLLFSKENEIQQLRNSLNT